jgi:hypothetical protein
MTVTPRGGRGAGTTTVPDNNLTAAAVSRDAVATNATNAKNAIGPRGARDLCAGAETGCIVPRADNIIDYCIVRTLHKYLQISADICRYLQISGHASRYLVMSEISSRDLITADRRNGKVVYLFSFLFCEKQNCK